jgi:HD-GYP domain-containing protein (c-di-GMP phosphodiesterase class II)
MCNTKEDKLCALLAEALAIERGYSSREARKIRTAAMLHDIGKTALPKAILNKPGKLTEAEFEIVKTHTTRGAELLSSIQGDMGEFLRGVCQYHHEYHNGAGYWGKPAYELPPHVPIISIADVYTALISERVYKKAWPKADALAYIQNQAGTQFSPELVSDFLSLMKDDSRVPAIL